MGGGMRERFGSPGAPARARPSPVPPSVLWFGRLRVPPACACVRAFRQKASERPGISAKPHPCLPPTHTPAPPAHTTSTTTKPAKTKKGGDALVEAVGHDGDPRAERREQRVHVHLHPRELAAAHGEGPRMEEAAVPRPPRPRWKTLEIRKETPRKGNPEGRETRKPETPPQPPALPPLLPRAPPMVQPSGRSRGGT